MSAWIVENRTINKIVDFIWSLQFGAGTGPCRYIQPFRVLATEELPDFGRQLHDLNIKAVQARYPSHAAEYGEAPYQYAECRADDHTVLRALDCYLYQCSEGDIPETSNLYGHLRKLGDQIARALVSEHPAYKAAPWE